MKRTLIFIFTILIISCNRTEESVIEESLFEIKEEINDFQIYVDPQALDNYKEIENASNKDFIDKLLKTISKFEGKKADTTIFQICNIDNLGKLDTLKNRIYFSNNEVIVNSSWTKNGLKLWEFEVKNPYLWIDDSNEFQDDERNPWVPFTIGIYYAIPEILSFDSYAHIDKQLAFQMGVSWAERENVKIPKEEYANYLNDFKGDIIAFGHPESREGLFMWYEPIKMFSLFYSP